MSDHSEQKSTELSTVNPGVLGGLILLSIPIVPILTIMGLFQALDKLTENTDKIKEDDGAKEEDKNGKMD